MKQLRPYQQQAIDEAWNVLKTNDEPVLLMASVGAGKSLMLSSILQTMEQAGKRALCLVNNAELVRNNCKTFNDQGGHSSIYCAALNCKDSSAPVVFGTPQSVLNAINNDDPIANIKFNIIVVDEAHAINYLNHRSGFMRILRHYKQRYPAMRLLGATGTNFRFKGSSIVGEHELFKTQVGNITTESLIDSGYLIEPHFEVDKNLVIDFSKVKIKQTGQFDYKQLEEVVSKSTRLTALICKQLILVMEAQSRFGVFIFATTKKHAEEILSHLPNEQSALILGDTPQDQRTKILDDARIGKIKYIVNIAIISVGVDVPSYDTIAYLRPTESLVLLVQTMGRALRLSPCTNKKEALVMDFAGNIERHKDWDNPIIMKAAKDTVDKDYPLVIECPTCNEFNNEHARRCIGRQNDKRCDYYFEFKECPNPECDTENDITARHCRVCKEEIIDPNKKLSIDKLYNQTFEVDVIEAKYAITGTKKAFKLNCFYKVRDKVGHIRTVFEFFMPSSPKAINIFYGQFVRKHCKDSSKWYMHLRDISKIEEMLKVVETPSKLIISQGIEDARIKKKIFNQN